MVGVPGRSKGCATCRKRRVKCDEAKPLCQRCIKAGFECLGYGRERLWRHTSTASFPTKMLRMGNATETVSVILAPPRELSFVAFQDDMCLAQLFQNFVWHSYGRLWLDQAAKGRLGALSRDAATALSQNSFGRVNRTREVELKGVVKYGNCLRILADELGSVTQLSCKGPELVVAVLILMIYTSMQADRAAAVFHLKGIARIMALCGPQAFQVQPYRNAFDAGRATLLVASLFSKQRMFLEEPKWQTVPWALDPTAKSAQSYLLDIFTVIPGLLEEYSRLEEPGSVPQTYAQFIDPSLLIQDASSSRDRDGLCDRAAAQLERLYRWRWNWQRTNSQCVSRAQPPSQSSRQTVAALGSTGTPRNLDRLAFDKPRNANDIMLYNAALMWLLALLWKLEPLRAASIIERAAKGAAPHLGQATHPPTGAPEYTARPRQSDAAISISSFEPLRRPGSSLSIRDPAVEICRVYEWQSRNHARCAAAEDQLCLYLFPVGMARSVLDAEPESRAWIRAMLDASPVTSGYGREGENIAGFGFYVTKEALDPDGLGAGGAGAAAYAGVL
ncbi:hypothetical protein PG995_002064 [Apiospora arundinis]